MNRLLIIEDDDELRATLVRVLGRDYRVDSAGTGREGIALCKDRLPDLVLLDVNLPDLSGFEVCRRLRAQKRFEGIPILMLTSESAIDQRIKGLDLGADDYVLKPCSLLELQARLRARIRAKRPPARRRRQPFRLGNLQLDPVAFEARIGGRKVPLTDLEFSLLSYFASRPGQVIPRARLLADLWPDRIVGDRTIDAHLANLRRKIAAFDHRLETVHRVGFALRPRAEEEGD